jgi:transcriptional regulator with XRE-family HTH domain
MVTSEQIKMGRAALDWSIQRLADECVVSARTIKRIEAQSGEPIATPANIKLIVETLENAGIEFIGLQDEGPGVRLWSSVRQF